MQIPLEDLLDVLAEAFNSDPPSAGDIETYQLTNPDDEACAELHLAAIKLAEAWLAYCRLVHPQGTPPLSDFLEV